MLWLATLSLPIGFLLSQGRSISHDGFFDVHSGAVQALTSIGVLALTAVLAGATLYSNYITRNSLEREWRPGIHVRVLDYNKPSIEFVNLGRMAIVVTDLIYQFSDNELITDQVDFVLPAGLRDSLSLYVRLNQILTKLKLTPSAFESKSLPFELGVRYTALGTQHESQMFEFVLGIAVKVPRSNPEFSLYARAKSDQK